MTLDRLNYLNISLILLSFALAWALPFEVFLFSYAVLGPLHYLTEINWLDQRGYFIHRKNDYWILVGLCVIVFFIYLTSFFSVWHISLSASTRRFLYTRYNNLLIASFTVAFVIAFIKSARLRLVLIAISVCVAIVWNQTHPYLNVFTVFLPTVIHVWFFTGAFMLAGALKSKSFSGYISFAVFLLCSLSLFLFQRDYLHYFISTYVQQNFSSSRFDVINLNIFNVLGKPGGGSFALNTPIGLSIQSFIAFAYTYHYLNWFSKTGLIQWHKVSRRRLVLSIIVWLLAMGVYAYSYILGLRMLFLLSTLHVFLEFPLNHRTLVEIAEQIKSGFTRTGSFPIASAGMPLSNKKEIITAKRRKR
jgi:hypothetical protein